MYAIRSYYAKTAKTIEIKTALLNLLNTIEPLQSMEVGSNCNPNEKFDIALSTTFNNMDDLQLYAVHPEHLKVVTLIREVAESRSCVDYEY